MSFERCGGQEQVVEIHAANAKTASRRTVTNLPNLGTWLSKAGDLALELEAKGLGRNADRLAWKALHEKVSEDK